MTFVRHAPSAQPRYRWLHHELLKDLRLGKYPIGSPFPTEAQLAKLYQVSRQTVRAATRLLCESGLILCRRRLGTIVIATQPSNQTLCAPHCAESYRQQSLRTRLVVLDKAWKPLDAQTRPQFNCPASHWLHVYCILERMDDARLNALSVLYLRDEYAAIVDHLHTQSVHLPDLHQSLYGQPVARIVQTIRADVFPPPQFPSELLTQCITPLASKQLTPALQTTYCHLDAQAQIMSAITHCDQPHDNELKTCWNLEPIC